MGELLLRKALACRQRLARIAAALPSDPEEIKRDERLEAFVAFNVFLLIQDAIDLATHVIASRSLGIPASHREAFQLLAGAGLIDSATADGMAQVAALRNRIAHTYGELDPVRLVREAPTGLQLVSRYLDELTRTALAGG